MSWNQEKIDKLISLWGKNGHTASQIAKIIGDVTRNAVIGKANRLNLSNKTITKPSPQNLNKEKFKTSPRRERKGKFKSLIIEKNFEPARNLTLEQLTDETCKYMDHDKHPNEPDATFCGRKSVEKFSYCPLHLMIIFSPKNRKEEINEKDEEAPFIKKQIKSA